METLLRVSCGTSRAPTDGVLEDAQPSVIVIETSNLQMTIGGGGVFIKYGYNIFSKIKPDSVDNINPLTRSNVEIGGRKNFYLCYPVS